MIPLNAIIIITHNACAIEVLNCTEYIPIVQLLRDSFLQEQLPVITHIKKVY